MTDLEKLVKERINYLREKGHFSELSLMTEVFQTLIRQRRELGILGNGSKAPSVVDAPNEITCYDNTETTELPEGSPKREARWKWQCVSLIGGYAVPTAKHYATKDDAMDAVNPTNYVIGEKIPASIKHFPIDKP